MFPDKIINKVPGVLSNDLKDKQGYLGNIDKLTDLALTETLERQKKLLEDRTCQSKMYASDNYIGDKVASSVELLNHFRVDELKMILNEGPRFDDVMKDILDCKDIVTDKEVLIASNKSLAEFNLTRESNMFELKRDIVELSKTGEQLYQKVEDKLGKLNKNAGSGNLEDVHVLLQAAAATIEEESESLAEAFLNGETDIESFLEQFLNKRKVMHLRRVKADKMSEMVQRRVSRIDNNSANSDRVLPPPGNAGHAPYFPRNNATPYPMGPLNAMPLPSVNKFNNSYFH